MSTDDKPFEFRTDASIQTSPIGGKQAMGQNMSGTLQLDQIQDIAQVSEGKALRLLEACVWCLLFCSHSNGAALKVLENNQASFYALIWPENQVDIEAIGRSYNQDDAIEDGAEAVALLLSMERTKYTAVERASTKTGIDYWLGFRNRNPNEPFHRAGRLEISGIMNENPRNKVSTRVSEKLEQTKPTDAISPVHVIVVEFSKPYATMVLKNANS